MISPELHLIAAQLEGLEETIITKPIDRAQFKANSTAYQPGKSGFDGAENESLLDLRLLYHEQMDPCFGRFCVPEERPFTPVLHPFRRNVTLPLPFWERRALARQLKKKPSWGSAFPGKKQLG